METYEKKHMEQYGNIWKNIGEQYGKLHEHIEKKYESIWKNMERTMGKRWTSSTSFATETESHHGFPAPIGRSRDIMGIHQKLEMILSVSQLMVDKNHQMAISTNMEHVFPTRLVVLCQISQAKPHVYQSKLPWQWTPWTAGKTMGCKRTLLY